LGTPPFVTSSKPAIPVRAFSSRFLFAEALPFRFLRIINTKRLTLARPVILQYGWCVASGDPDAAILSKCLLLDNAALPKNRIFFGYFSILLQQTLYGRTFRHVPLQLSLCTRPQIFVFS
jgi:hypothetical protein